MSTLSRFSEYTAWTVDGLGGRSYVARSFSVLGSISRRTKSCPHVHCATIRPVRRANVTVEHSPGRPPPLASFHTRGSRPSGPGNG
ncbi:hypothetical protein LUX57_44075 [Actinomadura madurae]|uniref:hypothetical protein n=1 Tax=Actinomadura madurae TaxID=1993 RepID=UPI0020D24347|nr:hypothetical protein [Actinomadura madurae]MCP9971254.1 hypothetical protein [Actinomadura madurae]